VHRWHAVAALAQQHQQLGAVGCTQGLQRGGDVFFHHHLGAVEQARDLLVALRNVVTSPAQGASSSAQDGARKRAIGFYRNALAAAVRELSPDRLSVAQPEAIRARIQVAAGIANEVAQGLFFGSLAHAFQENPGSAPAPTRARFFAEGRELLNELATLGLAPVAHNVIQILESLIDVADPTEIFLLVATTIRASKPFGYQYESLAVGHVVSIVRRYLADFRALFVDSAEARAGLRDILDTFVDAGWTETHGLVYSLDAIFR